ncbi:DNA cytosine methyltransferase [bacterium]|nr:DNA cytosine methyltransferase [bacterium]
MQCIELFAGAGGAALGLESAGIHHAALCEWDRSACATMRAAGLGPVVEGDVRDLDAIETVAGPGPIDLLWSSFPCQAFSTAGKRLGASDDRNGWPWTVDAIDRFRPRWFLGENVRGLLCHSSEGHPDPMRCPRCYLDGVIMPQLRERFAHAGYFLLNAADYGVAQHRRRVILSAGPAPLRAPPATHADPATLAQASMFGPRLLPWVSMGEALGITSERIIGGGRNPGEPGDTDRRYRDLTDEPSTTIAAVQIDNAGPFVVAAGETGAGRPRGLEHAAPTIGTGGTAYLLNGPSRAVTCSEVKGFGASANPEKHQRASDALFLATGRRRLTVEECARLQDFPADHPWQGTKTARFRQVGNAVPPTLARVVAEVVLQADRLQ